MNALREVEIGWPRAVLRDGQNGVCYVSNPEPLLPYPRALFDQFDVWAERKPEQVALAERDGTNHWRSISYEQLKAHALAIGEFLLQNGCTPERGLAILAPNSITHALLALGAMRAGIPYASTSPAYALVGRDYGKLKYVLQLMNPAVIYVDNRSDFAEALNAAAPADCTPLSANPEVDELSLVDALGTQPGNAIRSASEAVNPDTVVKLLFTSGSTGMPKAVINTQRMLCSNQEMIRSFYAFFADEPPVLVDWLPWNHTFGGNHNLGLTLYNGGTMYIDAGKPVSDLMSATIRNLGEISPNLYFNVPKGYEYLVAAMENNDALRRNFFHRLKIIQYAGAGLSPHVLRRLDEMACETVGMGITVATGYGATETAPFATTPVRPIRVAGEIGLPAPGLELKLVPSGNKTELRLRGPSITPGYWGEPEKTADAFDDEGFYCIRDAVRWVNPDNIDEGLAFDGRLAEDFKLSSGTWVNFAKLRAGVISAAAPLVREVVLTGHDRDFLGVLLFLDVEQARRFDTALGDFDEVALSGHPLVRQHVQNALENLARASSGSSTRIRRALIMSEPPTLETGEMTDKGSINQRAVLERRADQVACLYNGSANPGIICA